MKNKMIRNTNLSRNEKVTFHFDPLPNRLCFLGNRSRVKHVVSGTCTVALDHCNSRLHVPRQADLHRRSRCRPPGLFSYDVLHCLCWPFRLWHALGFGAFHPATQDKAGTQIGNTRIRQEKSALPGKSEERIERSLTAKTWFRGTGRNQTRK